MNLKLWRVVERFCRGQVYDPAAFVAFAQLVEENQEDAIRKKIRAWSDAELEQFSFLISGTLDTINNPQNPNGVLQCQGLYIIGSEASLLRLGSQEIPKEIRLAMAKSLGDLLPGQARIIIGSRIVPVTWVHGFAWAQWRAALARDGAMFGRPSKGQPKQSPESQAWMLPVFVEKGDLMAELEAGVSEAGVSTLGSELAGALAKVLKKMHGPLPSDVSIHPILAAAHCCWANAKMIAVYEWVKAIQTGAKAARRSVLLEEGPRRGSVRVKDARTKQVIATLKADPSFPVDGTSLALKVITDGGSSHRLS
ncbi:MAG TPA: hypothetical protein VFE51_14345 [Verrucomicrobiae bacterium]|nr:hypothetical protein [Verrucomicrobiae bacterium]